MGASPFGVRDMAGNVWEWVADWYAPTYDSEQLNNPTGAASGTSRVLRGASWYSADPILFRTTHRTFGDPASDFADAGFRCARTPPLAR
jgi:formylglycine-generating enzyme required for sulfatase activity